MATAVTNVEVGLSRTEVAAEQIKVEEKQRVLGVLPNFYVSYVPNAVPLTSKQKCKLAGRTVMDPCTFVFVGGAAGVEQAQNHFRDMGKARKFMQNASVRATPTRLRARSSEAPYCHRF